MSLDAALRLRPRTLLVSLAVLLVAGVALAAPHSARAATPTTTTLVAAPNPAPIGVPVMLTATVTCVGFIPTGTVTFFDGAIFLGAAPLIGVPGSGTALWPVIAPAPGAHSLTAVYSGDVVNCDPSTSPVTTLTVGAITPVAPPSAGPGVYQVLPFSGMAFDPRCTYGCPPGGLP